MNGYVHDYADVTWRDELTPVSSRYGDIYWSGGLDEKRHVFIEGSELAARLKSTADTDVLVVGEIGFGFGLNFLLTALEWRKLAGRPRRLHYVAIEKHPVHPGRLSELYDRLLSVPADEDATILKAFARQLVDRYPLPTAGAHTRWLAPDICLTLMVDDAASALEQLRLTADIWYLDGFSPALNDEIWNMDVYRQLADKSMPGTRLATYAVAGHVRRGLATVGFEVRRRPGFGQKAEMLTAAMPGTRRLRHRTSAPSTVAIVGAGLAGLFCAKALVQRDVTATVFETGNEPLGAASAIPQMAVYPQLALQPGHWNHFSLSAFQHLCADESAANRTGFVLLAQSDAQQERLARLAACFPDSFMEFAGPDILGEAAGLPLRCPGVIFPAAGWLDTSAAFGELFHRADLRTGTRVDGLRRSANGWQLVDGEGSTLMAAEHVILATGTAPMETLASLPVSPVRGQSLRLRVPRSWQPKGVLAGPVTLFPPGGEFCTLSATYDPHSTETAIRTDDTNELIEKLNRLLPGVEYEVVDALAGFRNVARDRMPVLGPVPDWRALDEWRHRQRHRGAPFESHQPGLYVCNGFGSHGATHAKLCAEYLAALICDDPLPLTRDWINLLRPERF